MRVLEIGGGDHPRANEHWKNVTQLDARKVPGVDVVHAVTGENHLPFDNGSFDVVFSSHILEHIYYRYEQDVINDWARVLKPDGELHTIVPSWEWVAEQVLKPTKDYRSLKNMSMAGQQNEWDMHYNMFTLGMLEGLYKGAGLAVRTSTSRPIFIVVLGRRSRARENYIVGVKK